MKLPGCSRRLSYLGNPHLSPALWTRGIYSPSLLSLVISWCCSSDSLRNSDLWEQNEVPRFGFVPGLVFVKSGASFNLFRPPHHPSQEHLRAMWTSHKGGHGRPQLKGHRAGYTRVQLLSQGQSDQWVSISPSQTVYSETWKPSG